MVPELPFHRLACSTSGGDYSPISSQNSRPEPLACATLHSEPNSALVPSFPLPRCAPKNCERSSVREPRGRKGRKMNALSSTRKIISAASLAERTTCRLSLYDSVTPNSRMDPTTPRSMSTASHQHLTNGRKRERLTQTRIRLALVVRRTKLRHQVGRIVPRVIRQDRRDLREPPISPVLRDSARPNAPAAKPSQSSPPRAPSSPRSAWTPPRPRSP